mmetsp:Transcript_104731/g.127919  ORF Transcript_104731/g.127919 Transcript_104731/m.127919 type:complete len:307 (+) Transcript_104731:78-998(+)
MKGFSFIILFFGIALSDTIGIDCTSQTNNFRYKAITTDNGPLIVFGDKNDFKNAVYCLTFKRIFETKAYNAMECEPNVDNNEIKFNELTFEYTNSSNCTSFSLETTTESGVTIKLDFEVESVDGNDALKYTFSLDGYVFGTDEEDAKLIVELEPLKCDDQYDIDSISMDSESNDTDSSEEMRRLQDDSSDSTSRDETGISDDDSDDFDLDAFVFRNTPNATVTCGVDAESVTIQVDMCYDDDENDLLLAFDRFGSQNIGCSVIQDPFALIDSNKLQEPQQPTSNADTIKIFGVIVSIFMSMIVNHL